MAEVEIDLLALPSGRVTAPAGCGKTQLIADAISRHEGKAPILVLTHTNAGVAALRQRLRDKRVPTQKFRIQTLDGWAVSIATMFPLRSGYGPQIPAEPSYPEILDAATRLLNGNHISDLIASTYARVFVDEYQDCSIRQHRLVCALARILTASVVADHMQAIFDFASGNPLAHWDDHVCGTFPHIGELARPHRWINVGAEPLGHWLLDARRRLEAGQPIDLRTLPDGSLWVALDGRDGDFTKQRDAAGCSGRDANDRVLVIGASQSPARHRFLASRVPGATVVERVDLEDVVRFGRTLDLDAANLFDRVLTFAAKVMVGVSPLNIPSRLKRLKSGKAKKPATAAEQAFLDLEMQRNHEAVAHALEAVHATRDVRVFRPAVLGGCIRALKLAAGTTGLSLHDAAIRVAERNRHGGRTLPTRAVGSTLLLKGLEAQVAVVLDAHELDVRNLYVALTRGSKKLVVCSRSPVLHPSG
jgi:hypothetical protein